MKNETKIGLKNAGVQIGLHGLLIPALGTIVGFIVQKKLVESEQKKALLETKEESSSDKPKVIKF